MASLEDARLALGRNSRDPVCHCQLGEALAELGQDSEAAKAFANALLLDPKYTPARIALGNLLVAHGFFAEAVPHLEQAVLADPGRGDIRLALAQALTGANRSEEAEPHLRHCTRDPELAPLASGMLGYWYQARGKFELSKAFFEDSVAANPVQSLSYFGWLQSNRVQSEDEGVFREAIAACENPRLDAKERIALHYAVAKGYADLGRFETAISRYDLANSGAFEQNLAGRPFNRKRYAEIVDGTIAGLTRDALFKFRGIGSARRLPILVVGMMRSGTTLVEQILSSHPSVTGAGELDYWLDHGREAFDPETRSISPKAVASLGEGYARLLRDRSEGRELVVDKMPQNFQMVGLIHLAFPKAPIIHIRRHPVDTCLSIYTTAYEKSPDFAHDRSSIVFAYRQYQRLTSHWRKTLPANRFLEIDYEDLVRRFESVSRQIIQFCGLPWNEACLHPQDNQRVVATPSLWQVRQPVYRSSAGRWRDYEPWLGEFATLLD